MKVPVFGKSGPRLVTGLVCASAAVGPTAIQPAAANAMKSLPKILDMAIPPDRSCFAGAYHDAGVCRAREIGIISPDWIERLCTGADNGLFNSLGYADDCPRRIFDRNKGAV
jgi:hypothetical protein